MKQLHFDMDPGEWDQPSLVKTPDDVYRIEVRLTFQPDSGKAICAVEATHENSRELVSWKLFPAITSHDVMAHRELLSTALAEALVRQYELLEPF